MEMTRTEWALATATTIEAVSRTLRGEVSTLVSPDKPHLEAKGGRDIKMTSSQNLAAALRYAWTMRDRQFTDIKLLLFINALALLVNKGLIAQDRPFFRTWEVPYGSVSPEMIRETYQTFCSKLANRLPLNGKPSHGLLVAAWAERELDLMIHPFADGCGRTTKILGAWILLRSNLPPPLFSDQQTYYAEMRQSEESWAKYYSSRVRVRALS